MVYYASASPAPSAHPHVSYASHPNSKELTTTGAYSEAGDHSEANGGIANLEAKMAGFETEVKDLKTEMKDLKTEIFQEINTLGIKFETSKKEIAHAQEEQLASIAKYQQEQSRNWYVGSVFGVSLTLYVIHQFLTRLSTCLLGGHFAYKSQKTKRNLTTYEIHCHVNRYHIWSGDHAGTFYVSHK